MLLLTKLFVGIQVALNGTQGRQDLSWAVTGDLGFHDAESFLQSLLEHPK